MHRHDYCMMLKGGDSYKTHAIRIPISGHIYIYIRVCIIVFLHVLAHMYVYMRRPEEGRARELEKVETFQKTALLSPTAWFNGVNAVFASIICFDFLLALTRLTYEAEQLLNCHT